VADPSPCAAQRVGEFLASLASHSPAPGGGAAAALAGATGAALVSMVGRFTLGRKKYAAHHDCAAVAVEQADALRLAFLADADADARAFERVTEVSKMPRGMEATQTPSREDLMEVASLEAAMVPAGVADRAAEVMALVRLLAGNSNPNVSSDLVVAATLAHATLEAAAVNVDVNLDHIHNQRTVDELRGRLSDAHSRLAVDYQHINKVLSRDQHGAFSTGIEPSHQ